LTSSTVNAICTRNLSCWPLLLHTNRADQGSTKEQLAIARISRVQPSVSKISISKNGIFSKNNYRSIQHRRTAFVARGALWGSEDIFRMRESIAEMHITMRKHPSHLKLHSELASKMPKDTDGIRNAEVLMCQNLRSCKLKSSPTSFFFRKITTVGG